MAKQTINTGTSNDAGNGDNLRTAFTKINENFSELYTLTGSSNTAALKDIKGSVFADDSTVMVDSVNGTLNGDLTGDVTGNVTGNLTGNVTSTTGTSSFANLTVSSTLNLTGATVSSDVNFGTNDLTGINNLTIGGSLLTNAMSPLLATGGNGQNLSLAGGQSTAGDGGDAILNAGAGTGSNGDVQIGSSNTANIVIGDGTNTVDYPSGTSVDFTGATVTGLASHTETDPIVGAVNGIVKADGAGNISAAVAGTDYLTTVAFADLTGKPTTLAGYGITDAVTSGGDFEGNVSGSVFADDSTLLVDGVNGIVNISNQSIDALSDVNTTTYAGAPSRSMQPLIWDNIDNVWYPGNGISLTSNLTMEDNSFIMLRENAYLNFEGSITDGFDTKFLVVNPTANRTIRLPDADGTVALTNQLNGVTTGQYTGDVTGSVFADNSTVLVDGVNGTLNSSALTKPIALADNEKITFGTDDDLEIFHNSSNGNTIIENNTGNLVIKGSNLFLQSASSEYFFRGAANGAVTIYHDNVAKFETTADGISVTDHIALPDSGELRLGTDNDMQILHSGASGFVKSTTGTLVLQGSTVRIQDAGSSQTAISASNGIATLLFENTAVLNTTAGGIQIEQGVEEKFATLTGSTGVVAHDCDNGHVFYHTGAAGDITANFTNLGLTAEYGTNLTVIINQGATPYEVTAVQIGGVAQTINWQGGSAPTGNANGIDSFSFTILNDGGTYVVLGQMVDFT